MTHDIDHCQGAGLEMCESCKRYLAHKEVREGKYKYPVYYLEPNPDIKNNKCWYYYEQITEEQTEKA